MAFKAVAIPSGSLSRVISLLALLILQVRLFYFLNDTLSSLSVVVQTESDLIINTTAKAKTCAVDTDTDCKEDVQSSSETTTMAPLVERMSQEEFEQVRKRVLETQEFIGEIVMKGGKKMVRSPSYKFPPPHPHPFAGAMDENKTWGYVHDPRVLRKQNITATIHLSDQDRQEVCSTVKTNPTNATKGLLTDLGLRVLGKVQVLPRMEGSNKPRIFCSIYSYEKAHEKIKAIAETWGSRCDGFFVASTFTNRDTGEVHLPHAGTEGRYDSIWQKVRSMMAYIYINFGHEYDYYHFCGDDTYIFMENLIHFLETNPKVQQANKLQKGVSVGGLIKVRGKVYNDGGPGYTINKHALEFFFRTGLSACHQNTELNWEDMFMGICIEKHFGGKGGGLVSTSEEGTNRIRSSHWGPNDMLNEGLFLSSKHKKFYLQQRAWRTKERGEPTDAYDSVSNTTIAFHWIKNPNQIRQIDRLFYPKNSPISDYCDKYIEQ